jgi:hypothetical protein
MDFEIFQHTILINVKEICPGFPGGTFGQLARKDDYLGLSRDGTKFQGRFWK